MDNPSTSKFCQKCGTPLAQTLPLPQVTTGTGTGLAPNIAGLLCYVAGWITGMIFYLIDKNNSFVRFHAMQSIIFSGALTIVQVIISVVLPHYYYYDYYDYGGFTLLQFAWLISVINVLIWIFFGVLSIVLMMKAYQGQKYRLPIAGRLAEQWTTRI
jgi:uncharacterized membrane protein